MSATDLTQATRVVVEAYWMNAMPGIQVLYVQGYLPCADEHMARRLTNAANTALKEQFGDHFLNATLVTAQPWALSTEHLAAASWRVLNTTADPVPEPAPTPATTTDPSNVPA